MCALTIYGFALNFQRQVNEDRRLDKEVDERLGMAFGFFKAILVIQLFLGLLFYNEAFSKRDAVKLKRGPVVSAFLGLGAFSKPLVYVIAPYDIAKGFSEKGLSRVTEKPRE